jgi:succinate dehydrogenase hydrophobic anchor subunit
MIGTFLAALVTAVVLAVLTVGFLDLAILAAGTNLAQLFK